MPEKDPREIKVNDIWLKYEASHDYMMRKQLVDKVNKFWSFYLGDQWIGLKRGNEELPSMNFIKPIVKYKVSTVSQNSLVANFSDASDDEESENVEIYRELNRRFAQSWDKAKMGTIAWNNNKAAAVQGDSYVYWGSKDTKETPQIIGSTSILFGDENEEDIQKQPYIIIRERLAKKKIIEQAKENGVPEIEIATIATDNETQDEIYNKDEVKDKVTSVLYMCKRDGVVNVAKATRGCIYEPLHPLAVTRNGVAIGGLSTYPIVPMKWEPKPNSMRGLGEVEMLIPNQLEVNKTLARRAMAVKLAAFPRIAYDATAITNPADLDKVGKAIGVTTGNAQSISQAIAYLNPSNISSDAQYLFNDLIDQTKDLNGAGDNALGNVDPERASGQAIIAVRDQTQVPLNEQINSYRQWVENVAMLWFDMWLTYEPDSFYVDKDVTIANPVSGTTTNAKQRVRVPYETLLQLKPSVRIDVSEDNKWTKLSEQQSTDQLLEKGHITFEEWADLSAENSPIPKAKILKLLNNRKEVQAQQAQMGMLMGMPQEQMQGQNMPAQGEQMSDASAQMPVT